MLNLRLQLDFFKVNFNISNEWLRKEFQENNTWVSFVQGHKRKKKITFLMLQISRRASNNPLFNLFNRL
jgi:hypothetical protein